MDPMELDPEKNPSPYGASSEPPLDEAQAMLDESEEIAANLTTDWEPSGLPAEVFATKESGGPWTDRLHDFWYNARNDRKHLSDADQADLARENATIRENVVAAGSGPHHFKPAEWTHPNGHPRCILCGAEERTDGMCTGDMVPTDEDARSPSRPKEAKGDTSGHEFHGNRYTGGLGDSRAFIAGHFGAWHEAMSPAQQRALAFYQSPGYQLMNGLLRGEKLDAPAKDLSRARTAITNLSAAIADAPPLAQDVVAFRGMSKAQFDFNDGATNRESGFTSVALDRNAASLSGSGEQVMVEIRIPAGARVGAGYSRELILPANSALRVVSGGSHPVLEYVDSKGDVKYSESEDRDDHGRWTSGGGDATATVPDVSGNHIRQGQHVFDVASGKPGTVFAVRVDRTGNGKHLAMVHMPHFRNAASPTGVHIVYSRSLASHQHEAYQNPSDLAAIRLAQAAAEHQFMGANEYAQREAKGDAVGHEFHGNRYTGGLGGGSAFGDVAAMPGGKLTPEKIQEVASLHTAMIGGYPPKDTSMTDHHPEYGGLTGVQAVALASYQRSGYGMMNDRLRAGSPPIMNEYTGERLVEEEQWRDEQIKAIDEAMEPLKNQTTVYRAIGEGGLEVLLGPPPDRGPGLGPGRLPSGQDLRDRLAALVGSTIEDKAYCSTTTDKEVAGVRTHHSEVLVQMDVEPGVGYIDMNAHHLNDEGYAHEKEILLARGGKFEITGVSDKPTADFGTEYPVYVLHMRRAA